MSLREALTLGQELFVRQELEWVELQIVMPPNYYVVRDANARKLGSIAEVPSGFFSQSLLGSRRPLDIRVLEADGSEWLRLTRPFVWWWSSFDVTASDGTPQGRVERRLGGADYQYDLLGPDGRAFARIQAPRWRARTFPVEGEDGVSRAEIAKEWGGVAREMFTEADTFRLQFAGTNWQLPERAVVLAAAVLIDFDCFE